VAPRGHVLHFLMRYSDNLRKVDTLQEHRSIADRTGSVWWGKFGVGIARSKVDKALHQIESELPTFLFLATNRRIQVVAEIVDVLGGGSRSTYQPKAKNKIPAYYRNEKCSLWFEIRNIRIAGAEERSDLVLFNDPLFRPNLRSANSLIYLAKKSEL
jgi:hypothetical protein